MNIFVKIFIFVLPKIISFNEISFNFLKESINEDNPPPLFLSILFTIAFATISDALSESFATAGIFGFTCFNNALERLSIAFLIPFVSSRIS